MIHIKCLIPSRVEGRGFRGPARYLGGIRKECCMKDIKYKLSPMEYKYFEIFGEMPEDTWQKNLINGSKMVQFRMDSIWRSMKERNKKVVQTELEKEGCPWLT